MTLLRRTAVIVMALALAVLGSALGIVGAKEGVPSVTIIGISTDETYGYQQSNPIKVGGVMDGPARERAYLELLRGPNGESIRYERNGSCCGFETPNSLFGGGMLDIYSVWIGDNPEPVKLYINMYDYEQPKAPKGFTFAGAV